MTQNTKPISPLRQRLIDDMTLRKLSPKTQSKYVRAAENLTHFLGRSPDTAMAEDLRRYQLRLVKNGISSIALNATITALRFFFQVTLDRADAMAKMSSVHVPHTLPVVLSCPRSGEDAGRGMAVPRPESHQPIEHSPAQPRLSHGRGCGSDR